jgi:AbrB family looped-hinge helix DNA binding protein
MGKHYATITAKGQLTLPKSVRDAWGLKPGDQVGFEVLGPKEGRVEPYRRRSILEGIEHLTIKVDAPLSQDELDAAVAGVVAGKLTRGGPRS